jgi:mannose/fructose-specific phosphotransferase system component IIA
VSRVPALIVMHGDLAEALLRAAALLYGPVEGVEVMSNQNLSRTGLEEEIAVRVAAWPEGGLVLTDLWGGSCHTCGASAARGREVIVVSGLNLPILLDYLHNRDTIPAAELAERLLRKGQDSIRLQRAPS